MKAKIEDMIPVALDTFDPAEPAPFPIYLHLPKNEKFVPLRHAGDALGDEKYRRLRQERLKHLWTLVGYKKSVAEAEAQSAARFGGSEEAKRALAERLGGDPVDVDKVAARPVEEIDFSSEEARARSEGPAAADAGVEPGKKKAETTGEEMIGGIRAADLPNLVEDALTDEVLSSEEKAEILSAVSQDMLRVINQVATRGEEARSEGLRRGKEVVDKILFVAAQDSDVYSEILKIWSAQDDIDHTTAVGTLCVMFAMCLGYHDEKLLSDIAVAALFHDIGVVQMGSLVGVARSQMSAKQAEEFHGHVDSSLRILKESGLEFHPRVLRMIEEHHECFDGSGYPRGLKGAAIEETSQLLHLANYFDRLCSGHEQGVEMSPAEAFDYIYEEDLKQPSVVRVDPEVLQRLFQFMEREAESSAALREEAEKFADQRQSGVLGGISKS